MSEHAEVFRALRRKRQDDGRRRRAEAAADFIKARDLARSAGLTLLKHSDAHYNLLNHRTGSIINLYPGNRRIYADKSKAKPPFLRVVDGPESWLYRVVKAAAEAS